VLTVATDEDGRFIAEDLRAGAYIINVSAFGYVMPGQSSGALEPAVYRPGDSVNITLVKGGIITGKVVGARGEPVVAVSVRPIRVRDLDGKSVRAPVALRERQTDDRGIYRLYGLEPGIYIIAAGGAGRSRSGTNPYEYDTPTYYPSATRAGAAEIRVDLGMETSGVDVRYRGDRGHLISGSVDGLPTGSTVWITLNYSGSNVPFTAVSTTITSENRSFAIYGIPGGEYDLLALGSNFASRTTAFALRHITIKGADVTGLNIALTPFGSIAGRIQFEPNKAIYQECQTSIRSVPTAVPLKARLSEQGLGKESQTSMLQGEPGDVSNESGEFVLSNLVSGLYHLETHPPDKGLYVKSITLGPGASDPTSKALIDAGRHGLTVKPGEQLKGVTITLTDGAASLRGRVITKGNLPASIRLHLVPVERELADEILRYVETPIQTDGSFTLKNLAPGRYWVVARPSLDVTDSPFIRPVAWDAKGRAKLRGEAEATNVLLELQPCQQMMEYVISYTTSSPGTSPGRPSLPKSN